MRIDRRKYAASSAQWQLERWSLNEGISFNYIGFSASGIAASDYTEMYNDSFRTGKQEARRHDRLAFILCLPCYGRVWYPVSSAVSVGREYPDGIYDQYRYKKRRCISTLLICTVWMLVEVIVLLALEAVGTDKCVIDVAGSFISKMCMLLFSVLLGRYAKKKQYTEIPLRYFIITLLVPASSIYMMHHIFLMTALYAEYSFSRWLLAYFSCLSIT